MRHVAGWLGIVLAAAGPVMFACLMVSPRLGETISLWMADSVLVEARVTACVPRRDGIHRKTVISCRFTYYHDGRRHAAESESWSSQSPFLTSTDLARVLAEQSGMTKRQAKILPGNPSDAGLLDQRWVAMPPLWFGLLAIFLALTVFVIRFNTEIPYRRVDLAPDPSTGHLVPINNHRRDRIRWRLTGQALAALLVGGICLFGLSNQPANAIAKLGMTALKPVSARLVNCDHHYYRAGRTGNDQIDCDFVYRVSGRTYLGKAESVRFGLFATDARLDAEVARLRIDKTVTAYVDRRYPAYAWAFINQDAFAPLTWGMFELELGILDLLAGAGFAASLVRWHRAR